MSDKPIEKLRDGLITATIWRNQTQGGDMYAVSIIRSYKADDDWKQSTSYTPRETLRVANLARRAYDRIEQLKAEAKAEAKKEAA